MARASLLAHSVAKVLEAEQGKDRYVDQCISLRVHETGEELIRVGGRWDRREKRYVGPADKVRVLKVHKGQERAARWLAEWLRRKLREAQAVQTVLLSVRDDETHEELEARRLAAKEQAWQGFERPWSALFFGGRRGGKSRLAVWGCVLYAVMFCGKTVWCVSPTQEETDELEQALRETIPKHWYRYRGDPKWTFTLANGTRIRLMSGHKPSSLKRGKCDLALYNEGQLMTKQGFTHLRGALVDDGGMVIIAANPPDSPIGRWIEEHHDKAKTGKIKCKLFDFDPRENPFIEYQSLLDLAAEVDDATYRREVLGELVPIGDVVFYSWSDGYNWVDPPADWIDVTRAFTRIHLAREFTHIVGADFQKSPHMAAVVMKAYLPPEELEAARAELASEKRMAPMQREAEAVRRAAEHARLWVVDEVIASDTDEDGLIDELEQPSLGVQCPCCRERADGYKGEECAVIGDASGEWQDADRTKGRGSFDWFRKRGWRNIYVPDSKMKRNPEIVERCKVGNAALKARSGQRRFFVAKHCEGTARSLRLWENRNGAPHRRSDFAHVCDAATYPLWRFWPRRRKRSGDESAGTVRTARRFEGRDRMRGWGSGARDLSKW